MPDEKDAGEFRTEPNPNQPDRCPSIDPLDTLQCGRAIHDDDQCQFGGIAWRKGSPRYMSDRERADRLEAMCDRLAERLAELPALWREEGRAVMFNRAGDDLTPAQRVGKWINEKTRPGSPDLCDCDLPDGYSGSHDCPLPPDVSPATLASHGGQTLGRTP